MLPKTAVGDKDDVSTYNALLGAIGGANLLHIYDDGHPLCGASLNGRPFNMVEHMPRERPVCRACRFRVDHAPKPKMPLKDEEPRGLDLSLALIRRTIATMPYGGLVGSTIPLPRQPRKGDDHERELEAICRWLEKFRDELKEIADDERAKDERLAAFERERSALRSFFRGILAD